MNAKVTKPNNNAEQSAPAAADNTSIPYWLLKDGKCKKLGKHAEGGIKYQILASDDRKHLHIRITDNEGGGYYSKEIVPFDLVELHLDDCVPDKPFPSKALKDAFKGKSSNNAGFLAAILRAEDLLTAAPDAETQHVRHGDMATWKAKLLTEAGTQITLLGMTNSSPVADGGPDETANKTLSLPRKKA